MDFILNKENNYIWVVRNLNRDTIHLFYDGENARDFLRKEKEEQGDCFQIFTSDVLDII